MLAVLGMACMEWTCCLASFQRVWGGSELALGQGLVGQRMRHELGGLLCWLDRMVQTVVLASRLLPVWHVGTALMSM